MLPPVSCNDDASPTTLQSELLLTAQAGQPYLIQVGHGDNGAGGRLVFSVPEPGAPALLGAALGVLAMLRRRRRAA